MIPTPTFFYGMRIGDEVALEIDPGKTLFVSLQGIQTEDTSGVTKVQFELNGQSRTVLVPRDGSESSAGGRAQAPTGDPMQIGAPMPGTAVTVAVAVGQRFEAGATLLSLEAMKMETM